MAKTNTAYQNCNTISNANNKHFNQVALQNISDNTKNFLTERQTITNQFNNGLASSEGLRMMVQNNSNKKPEESNEDNDRLSSRILKAWRVRKKRFDSDFFIAAYPCDTNPHIRRTRRKG